MTVIISTEKLPKIALDILAEWQVRDGRPNDQDLSNADVLMSWTSKITGDLVSKLTNLKAIQFISAGVDDADYSAIPRGVRLFSNADAYSVSVAEHAWALVLVLAKNICKSDEGENRILSGKTIGVLGCGGIGSEVARIGRGFNMHILGLSRSFLRPEYFDEKYRDSPEDLQQVLESADVVVCCLPLNRFTKNLFRRENLRHLKTASIVVNIARAEIFEKDELLKFLKERQSTRFGTDVFWRRDGREEFESKFWGLENFIGTKHRAGATANSEVKDTALMSAAENVASFLKTGIAKHEIKVSDYV